MKTFYQLLLNTVISTITNMTVWFALVFFVYLQTKAVMATAIMSGIYLVMVAFSGFWLGSLVDHYKKKLVMVLSSIVSLCMYVMGFLIYLFVDPIVFTQLVSSWLWIFILVLLLGVIASNIRTIALPTLVTILVPEKIRDKANGMVGTISGVSFLVVSVISGFLVAAGGMYYVFLLSIGLLLIALIHLIWVPIPEPKIVHIEGQPKKVDIRGTLAAISKIPGLFALILFTTFNNFLGGVFMSLMDAYGLSLVSVEIWGLLWGFVSLGFIFGGLIIAKWGLGKNPLWSLFRANIIIWSICIFFTIQPSILLLTVGTLIYLTVVPYIEASEQTIIQKVVPAVRQGRVFGFAQSVEQAASPLTAFLIGPITQYIFIPFMTVGAGVDLIGNWFGIGADRGIALVFTLTGIIGLIITLLALHSKSYHRLTQYYLAD